VVALVLLAAAVFVGVWESAQLGLVAQPLLAGLQALAAVFVAIATAGVVLSILGSWIDSARPAAVMGCLAMYGRTAVRPPPCVLVGFIRPPIFFS